MQAKFRKLVQKYGSFLQKLALKHAKFGAILDNCRLWQQISLERITISKIGQYLIDC